MVEIKTDEYEYKCEYKHRCKVKKSGVLAAVLILTLTMLSCENIAPEDMNIGDLGNILNVIIKDDATETRQVPILNAEQSAQTGQRSDITENTIEYEAENKDKDNEIGNTTASSGVASESVPETRDVQGVNQEDRELSEAVKYFPEIPEAFRYVPFPNSLTMTDLLRQAIKNLGNLRGKDFEGGDFYITTPAPSLIKPLPGGDTLSEARRYRTQLVETAYNIDVQPIYLSADDMYRSVSNSVAAGEYISDIICAPLSIQSLFIQDGLLINLRKMPFINLEADYYNQSSVAANTIDGEIYGAVSDLMFDPGRLYAVFYNKELLKNCGMDNLNSMYENGEWTYDNMLKLCKILASNVDTAEEDIFTVGLGIEKTDVITGMYIPYSPVHTATLEDFNARIQEIISRIVNNTDRISPLISQDDEQQRNAFSQGSMLFSVMTLDIIPQITDSPFDWSILPMPILDESKEERYSFSFPSQDAAYISVLKGVRNTEKCGIITEALSLASYNYMRDMYVNDLMTYNLRDMMSVNIVNAIINDVRYN